MGKEEEEKNPNPMIDLVPDLQEEIFLRLPLKSILKFKTLSKQWRSILESRSFSERRRTLMNKIEKRPKILVAAGDHWLSRKAEEEVEIVCLDCDAAKRPSLTCEGLVCIPVPGWVNVLNPSTGEFLRFPSGPNPVNTERYDRLDRVYIDSYWWHPFPGFWAMGFGKNKVNGSYNVVRMFFDDNRFEILDVNIGEWRKLQSPAPYYVEGRQISAYVNGSIYWFNCMPNKIQILALDLHTEQFRDVSPPPYPSFPSQLVNLEGRLALAIAHRTSSRNWELKIWTMDAQEETWSNTYNIRLSAKYTFPKTFRFWCRPVAVSKQGNVFFYDSDKQLFKYCPKTEELHQLAADICVISSIVENLVPLRQRLVDSVSEIIRTYGIQHLDNVPSSRISRFCRRIPSWIPNVLLTTTVAALVISRYYTVSRR